MRLTILRNRADFLKAARGRKAVTGSMIVQARPLPASERDEMSGTRVGFTCSKKVGNAVTRNRAKRRLRAVARAHLPQLGREGWDYVLIGRAGATVSLGFDTLEGDFLQALEKLHGVR